MNTAINGPEVRARLEKLTAGRTPDDVSSGRLQMAFATAPRWVTDPKIPSSERAAELADIFNKQGDPRTALADFDLAMAPGKVRPDPLLDEVRQILLRQQDGVR